MNSFKVMRSEENSNNAEGPGAPTQSNRDRVYVSTKHWNTGRRRRKLADQMAGPFPIIARAGNAYRLQLPPGINVHPVVNPEYLRKDPNNPLSGQTEDPQPPIEVNGKNEWEIEKILASRKCGRRLYRLVVSGEGSNQESEGQLQLSRFQERRLLRRIRTQLVRRTGFSKSHKPLRNDDSLSVKTKRKDVPESTKNPKHRGSKSRR
jgi:hypothetical protein